MKYYSQMCNRLTGSSSKGDRAYMEDCFSVAYNYESEFVDPQYEYLFLGVFDGHGGSEAAKYAKAHLESNITRHRGFWSRRDADVLKAIREGFLQTHNEMWKEQESWPKTHTGFSSTSGTTASVAFLKGGKLYIGHVGDSKIVLAEQSDESWKAISLTTDHKPESPEEKSRIVSAGGKVISKAGVPRVVWHRPKSSQAQGRQLRSTKTDEIPFLAIARSLGDLWSYNSSTGQFVVSPEPDLIVYDIDSVKHKCLIFATDGLWNVISPQAAVDLVYDSTVEDENPNPSNVLVDEALHRWNANEKRADNVSVITFMLSTEEKLLPKNENIAFLEDVEMYPIESHQLPYEYDSGFESPEYQDISHMAVDECDVLTAVKKNPNNAIFPQCVMRQYSGATSTFERFDYVET